jgi:hypothetical protein
MAVSVPVRDLLSRLDGQWMIEPYPSPDHQLYGRNRQTVWCAALSAPSATFSLLIVM